MNGGEELVDSVEKCPRCGTALHSFSKKYAYSMNRYYCVKCAEELDRNFLAKMTCAVCGKHLGREEVKYVMSSKFFGGEAMPIADRLVCAACHESVEEKVRNRSTPEKARNVQRIKTAIRKSIMQSVLRVGNTPRF
ncbi:MAG: hypothetical protein ACP5SJ_02535 [Candidatus Micrarchaeia archaeon]